ncbi:hypothetical protein [Agrobacterium vitis]|uniref:hypothetical protein n=1 Tax=Agrobacterium vitis TaxID=373 RepID=UPI0012E7F52B|nr:hypothetical protein [Agrobacterium vitis]MUZ66320.1 hypothetical protein [Agrobacterium vitis]
MAAPGYELSRLDPNTFEHLVNSLAIKVLGAGVTGFGPGADGGRDGLFVGPSSYPTERDGWSGVWYIQSKFHAPGLSKDPQKWLLERIEDELAEFDKSHGRRKWPDNWIIATNIDPSGVPETGAFDAALALVAKRRPGLAKRFAIWGGSKIIALLVNNENVADYYREFITPGHVIKSIYNSINEENANYSDIIRHFVVTEFKENLYTKLEQAGSNTDNRPYIHKIFVDLPYESDRDRRRLALRSLARSLACTQSARNEQFDDKDWQLWQRDPDRARVWFIKGGPGQGKSTITQYIAQIQRACLILDPQGPTATNKERVPAREICAITSGNNLWPIAPRVPVVIELRLFAQWYGEDPRSGGRRILAYLTQTISDKIAQQVRPGTLKSMFSKARWLFIFDGLDEVPGDIKDEVAEQVTYFVDDFLVGIGSDASIICTSRPQGYSGQFDALQGANVILSKLPPFLALECAKPLIEYERTETESKNLINILKSALTNKSIAELMTTPLQSHIMAIIVRDGGRPPERKWKLFNTFYEIMKKREANKNFPDPRLASLLRDSDKLIKAVHARLGFELHARAETKSGATTSLSRPEFEILVRKVVSALQDEDVEETVSVMMEATVERLVFVNTPENSQDVRFDIRQLQEFFAAEEIRNSESLTVLSERLRAIVPDSHWREVVHFVISALIENGRRTEVSNVASVLGELDRADDSSHQEFQKRLSKGSLIAARLLSEGVLEEDKRIRGDFANCIYSLIASTESFEYFRGVTAKHTTFWIINILIAAIQDRVESECIGAAIGLAALLRDDDPRASKVSDLILSKSLSFQMAIFSACNWFPEFDEPQPSPIWLTKVAISALMDEKWYEQPADFIESAILSIRRCPSCKELLRDFVGENFASIEADLLGYAEFTRKGRRRKRKKIGTVFIEYFETSDDILWCNWNSALKAELVNSSGIFKAIYYVSEIIHDPVEEKLRDFVELYGSFKPLTVLPEPIRQLYKINYQKVGSCFEDISRVLRINSKKNFGDIVSLRNSSDISKMKENDIGRLLEHFPFFIMNIVFDASVDDMSIIAKSNMIIENLAFIGGNSSSIGMLIAAVGKVPAGALRERLVTYLTTTPKWNSTGSIYVRNLAPFILELPSENVLLPWVLRLVVSYAETHRWAEDAHRSASMEERASELIESYIADCEQLKYLAYDKSVDLDIRAAAIILCHMHPKGENILQDFDFVDLYSSENGEWLVPSLFFAIRKLIVERDDVILAKVSSLLAISRSDYNTRLKIDGFISRLREATPGGISNSPKKLWELN